MKLLLLVLGVALLCGESALAQNPRGRGRLRELVQKARAGDVEAQELLAARRRKVVRNKDTTGGANREQSAIASVLGGGAAARRPSFQSPDITEAPAPVRARLPSFRQRGQALSSRARSRGREPQAEVTTFRPTFTPRAPVTEAPTTEAPAPTELVTEFLEAFPTEAFTEPPRSEPQQVDLTPTNIIPSIFQPAQFGPGGRGVQAAPQSVVRTSPRRPASVRTETRPRARLEPHRAIQRGLETGSRSELINLVETNPEEPRTPPVQTTRRYSYFDEAGNYVFGYEAEDGSFKEEIRGLDCIVNGKYGYVDPDGIRREFTYVSGNKCDPNDPEGLLQAEGITVAPNDQFLHQTMEQVLDEAQLASLQFNRRRKPVQQQNTVVAQRTQPARVQPARTQPIRTQPARVQPARPRISRPRTRPVQVQTEAPAPVEVKPAEPAPQSGIPSMFQPAQFGSDGRGVAPTDQERFPVPDFLSGSRSPAPSRGRDDQRRRDEEQRLRDEKIRQDDQRREEERQRQEAARQAEQRVADQGAQHVDLTPTNVIPSIFQPAQFGAGGRGVQAGASVTRPPTAFNFEQEFQSVFSNFQARPAPAPQPRPAPRPVTPRPTPRPTPPPTPAPTRAPTTRAPAPSANAIPSLFQPAQFGSARPAPPKPAPAPLPAQDDSFTLTASQPSSSGAHQLVFDATTGTFKTVPLQASSHFSAPGAPVQPRPAPAPRPAAPVTSRPVPVQTGRPLFVSSNTRNSPLPPIPQTAADFDKFFAQFTG